MEDLSFFKRRDFIKGAGALGITGIALWTGGCESWWKKIKERPTRRNIANLPANDPIIQTYKDAVAAMIALPISDGRNWTKQAQIHNNKCVHGNWWFLPWHRFYLFYFEAICRKLTGNNDFALPYWNWTTSPSIPAPFWGNSNPLFNSSRTATQGSVANPSIVGQNNINTILGQTNFLLFASSQAATQQQFAGYGELEGGPHNYIHGFVGGDMGTYMSPLDPVFWCHHNMIECLWIDWNIFKSNPNTNDPTWSNFTFSDFVDADGNPVTSNVAVSLLFPLLSYQFEPCAPGMPAAPTKDKATLEKYLREGGPYKLEYYKRYELRRPLTTTLRQAVPTRLKVEPDAFRSVLDTNAREKAILTIDEVEPPAKQDVFVRVFINKPDATAATSVEDPHYAGSFAFFCCEVKAEGHEGMAASATPAPGKTPGAAAPASPPRKLSYLVDVTPTVRKLSQGGSLSPDMDITLVTVPIEEQRRVETQSVNLGRLELGIARF